MLEHLSLNGLDNKNVLVTGASGLIGSAIIETLLKYTNSQVYALVRNKERAFLQMKHLVGYSNLHLLIGDVNDMLDTNISFHYIIHAASNANPNAYSMDPVGTIWTNVNGTRNLLEYGRNHNIERFLYISSGEVYGSGSQLIWNEEDSGCFNILDFRSCYPSSKRVAETLCISYIEQYKMDIVIARPCHTYGPNFTDSDNRAYAQFIRKARNKEDIVLKSTGEQFRSWIYIDDCVSGILTILLEGLKGNAYNIADESSNVTIKTLAEIIARIAGTKVIFQNPELLESKGYSRFQRAVFDTNKLRLLGWSPKNTIEQGLFKTIFRV